MTRNKPKANFKTDGGKAETRRAPIRENRTPGRPNLTNKRTSRPRRKKLRRARLPKICRKATKTRADLKSTKNKARGKKTVEEPNPATVPAISETKAARKKKGMKSELH